LESELFGHEKGAFTGAVSQKVGRIELADKGTLFLDEIGELPLELQPKLLRALQDREFERLGGVHTLRVDVRIISATNRDLHQDIADRKFREDLFYRLNVFPIGLPALRQRRTDIPILVHHFVSKHSARMGKHIETVPDETMTVLQNWNWPGNIRELENMIERMVILSKGRVLAAPPVELDAPQEIRQSHGNGTRSHPSRAAGDQWCALGSGWGCQPTGDQAHDAAVDAQAIRN
jgi:formate hydrogenlyase transcriptional activator